MLATQNPIEQEGTYPLPEAQVDRFMLKVLVDYPSQNEEREILDRVADQDDPVIEPQLDCERLLTARKLVRQIYLDPKLKDYMVQLVQATRNPGDNGLQDLVPLIQFGSSPRGTICLAQASRAHAFLRGRGYVIPEDIKSIGYEVLRHRVILSYEAEAEEITPDDVIRRVFEAVEVP